MSSTNFVDKNTPIVGDWLNDVNAVVYGPTSPAGTLRGDLANTTDPTKGAAEVGYGSNIAYPLATVGGKLASGWLHSVVDGGVVGNGVVDDTVKLQAFVRAWPGRTLVIHGTPLVSSPILFDTKCKIIFEGALGNASGLLPDSYIIKAASMTAAAIQITAQCVEVIGGGVVGVTGNTGDGIAIQANSVILDTPVVYNCGGTGIRVGGDAGTAFNCNSFDIRHPISFNNGGYGIYIHDGTSGKASADANVGTLFQPYAHNNASDGIRLGNCYWVTVLNGLAESNGGWGLYCSGNDNNTYPECRWANIIGGDYNEGNSSGPVFDQSYFSTFINTDYTSIPTQAPNGLQGSALRNTLGGSNLAQGFEAATRIFGDPALTATGKSAAGTQVVAVFRAKNLQNGGDGTAIDIQSADLSSGTYYTGFRVRTSYIGAGEASAIMSAAGAGGTLVDLLGLNPALSIVYPPSTDTTYLGYSSNEWLQTHSKIYLSGGVQVVGARQTGWGGATGGSSAAFNGSTATLAQTSAAVAQLITALFNHGLIGT